MKTVNFLEAVNSGKRFRPTDENRSWWFFDIHGQLRRYVVEDDETRNLELHKCDYSNVFEIEEKSITITESEFNKWKGDFVVDTNEHNTLYAWAQLGRNLGFTND